jgi:hypothetical protein
MASRDEVNNFLADFKAKMNVFDIIYRNDRNKNSQALLDLEITQKDRRAVIENLSVEDFCEGPLDDTLYGIAPMWVFGREVKNSEVYLKISMGRANNPVVCISFHKAEYNMKYPYKSNK